MIVIYALDSAHEKFNNSHVVHAKLIQGLTQIRYAGFAWLLQTLIFNSFIYKWRNQVQYMEGSTFALGLN